MATITPTAVKTDDGYWVATFTDAALGDGDQVSTGVAVPGLFNGMCVQAVGTWGGDGSVSLQGSNDGTNYTTLEDHAGAAVTFTANGLVQVVTIPRYIRTLQAEGEPAVTDVNVIVSGYYFR